MDIIMIRHGQTEDNVKGIYSRDTTKLTDKGKSQILESKKLLEKFDYEDIYYSPLTRTIESMETLGLQGIKENNIREIDFGIFKGKTFEETSKLYPMESKKWEEDPLHYRIPQGQSVLDIYENVKIFLEELIKRDKDALLVCHDGVIRLILCWVFDNPEYFFRFKVDNGSINVVSIEDGYKYIKKTNYK